MSAPQLFSILVFAASASVWAESYPVPRTVPADQPMAEILGEYVIAKQHERYIGWPKITIAGNGDLIVAFSGDRDWHVDP